MKKQKSSAKYFIVMSVLAFPLFYLAYNVFAWENDWMYHHKTFSIVLTVINAIAVFGIFGYMWANSRHTD